MGKIAVSRMGIGALALCVALFGGAAALGGAGNAVDVAIINALAETRIDQSWLTGAAVALTQLGSAAATLVIAAATAGLLVAAGRRRPALWLTITVLSGRLAVETLKLAIARPRPELGPWPVPVASLSFPSGHAANAMLTFVAVAMVAAPARRRGAVIAAAVLLAAAVGMTRPLLGVHWPSDLIGGWALAGGWLVAALALGRGWIAGQE